MGGDRTARCRRCGAELDPKTDDLEEKLCNECLQEMEEEEYYEEYEDADELDSMLGEYEADR